MVGIFGVTALMLQNLGGPPSHKIKHVDTGRMAVSGRTVNGMLIHLWTEAPLWELWDPATFAKGPGRGWVPTCSSGERQTCLWTP